MTLLELLRRLHALELAFDHILQHGPCECRRSARGYVVVHENECYIGAAINIAAASYEREAMTDEPNEAIMQFFTYAHLPEHLQPMSKAFAELAEQVLLAAPRGPERSVALRKLLEGKDAAVRAMLQKPAPWRDRASGPV